VEAEDKTEDKAKNREAADKAAASSEKAVSSSGAGNGEPESPRLRRSEFFNRIICGDTLDVMRRMPDGSVDLVVTSPPTTSATRQGMA